MQPTPVPQKNLLLILLLLSCFTALAQPDYTLPLAKPEKYRDKALGAEKTDEKKFTLPRRLFQGMITHYNYYYNATTKIEAILLKAKMAHKDDYTELLPFYNYSTKTTAADSVELDSVLYKATAGIVLHDLRNSYIDNLYLLIGQSYYYWGKFDSAYRIFQFINYNFYPKAKDEYFIVVGSNSDAAKGELKIATKEKKGIVQKAFSQPPSRNEALLWLAKTYAEDSLYAEASSLVQLLRKDPIFPKRLHSRLDEVQAYVYYKQELWDSTAFYLEKALVNAPNKTELARWEYLLAQLYALQKKNEQSSVYFNKAKAHTTDPVLYIHARIYEAQLVKNNSTNSIQQTLDDLVKLSKKERFDGFEDVLYYAAGGMALNKPDTVFAKKLYRKSIDYNTQNESLKNKAFLKLATIAFQQKDYRFASACYDSINFQDATLSEVREKLELRKEALAELVKNLDAVKREDSLQTVAKLPEKDLESYLKSLVRRLRKARGLKEEEVNFNTAVNNNPNQQTPVLFTASGTGNNWYFNNASQKSKGFNEFRARWGKRPNLDNWRRQAAVEAAINQTNFPGNPAGNIDNPNKTAIGPGNPSGGVEETDLTVEGLKQNLPLTDEKLKESNLNILNALFTQGLIYKNQLEDYEKAVEVFEEIRKRFSNIPQEEELLFELFYCYGKLGNKEKASEYQLLLNKNYPEGKATTKITEAKNPKQVVKDQKTIAYETIYNLFIEGRFEEALQQKKTADSVYGKSYWTPQLLYIESLYYVKQRNDSTAIITLDNIQTEFPGTPMAEKAGILKDVVSRRAEIEDYLTKTNIVRQTEDAIVMPADDGPKVNKQDQQLIKDSSKINIGNQPGQIIALEKPKPTIEKTGIEKDNKNAAGKITVGDNKPGQMNNVERPKGTVAKVAQEKDSVKTKITLGNQPKMDSVKLKPIKDVKIEMAYVYNASEPYVVLMYFDKVDPIYISESKIAFQRYNSSNHSGETINITVYETNEELNWLELGPYPDVSSILSYMEELKNNARQIVPWLPVNKYNFIVISERNLEILKTRKSLEEYKLFLRLHIKDKF
jgi:outer membrane protein assembly factor BamD (BamD/ComL family)